MADGESSIAYELRHLRAFVAVAEELHFGRAAMRLRVSQPTVSTAIRDLEHLLGVRLLDRSSRAVTVTAAGELLLEQARDILAASSRLSRTASELGEGLQGTFVVGLHDEGAAELTMPILEAFRRAEPELRLVVHTLRYETAHASLQRGETDVVVSGGTWSEAYEAVTLFHDQRGVVVGPGHDLYSADSLGFADVVDVPLFSGGQDNQQAGAFFDRFTFSDQRNGESYRTAGTAREFHDLLLQVGLGLGINAATASTLRFCNLGVVRYVPVLDVAPVPVTAAVPRSATRAQQVFMRVAAETAAELADRIVPSAVPAPGRC